MAASFGPHLLPKLGVAIDTSLAEWEDWLEPLSHQLAFSEIGSTNIQDKTTKTKALLYLLEILPCRHAALVIAYSDPKTKTIELNIDCRNLLAELQNPKSDVELGSWFNRTLVGKKFVKAIEQLEADLQSAEQGRLQELRRLKASHFALTKVAKESNVGEPEIGKLLGAMEEMGIELNVPGAFDDFKDADDAEANGDCKSGHDSNVKRDSVVE